MQVKEKLEDIKMKAKDCPSSLHTMYKEEVNSIRDGPWSDDTVALVSKMPTYQTYKTTLYRMRKTTLPKVTI